MYFIKASFAEYQQGAVLIVALVMLLILTIVGVSRVTGYPVARENGRRLPGSPYGVSGGGDSFTGRRSANRSRASGSVQS